jgi:hypothetical protein
MELHVKPAMPSGGHQEIVITDWRPHQKNSLRAFFSATLPSGLILHDLMLHEKDKVRWVGFPGREWVNQSGEKQYARFVEFTSRAVADRFRDALLAAIDRFTAAK